MKRKEIFLDKKGILTDKLGLMVWALVLSISLVIIFIVFDNLNDKLQGKASIPDVDKAHFNEWTNDYVETYDAVFIIIFVGIILAGLLFLMLLDTAPVIFFFIWFADLFLLYLSAVIGNAYARFQADTSINSFSNQFTMIPFVMSHLLEIMVIVSGIYLVVFFVKTRSSVL